MLVWDSLWIWVSYVICVTCPALMMFLRTCFSSCELSTLALRVCGPQLGVVFFKTSYSSAILWKTGVASMRRKQWASVLKNGVALKMVDLILLLLLFMVISFALPQSKHNSLFFLIIFLLEMWMVIPFFSTHSNQQLCLLCLLLDSVVVLSCPMTRYPILFWRHSQTRHTNKMVEVQKK